jgi:hypothetical protein
LDSKPTKSVKNFEENKFSIGHASPIFVLLSKVDQNLQFWTKCSQQKAIEKQNEQYCAVRLFIFKVAETFCQLFVCDCQYFLP